MREWAREALASLLPWLARRAHYVSTYCLHGDHAACRLTCKTCQAPCRCRCGHPTGP